MSMMAAILSVAPAVRFATRVPAPPRLRPVRACADDGFSDGFSGDGFAAKFARVQLDRLPDDPERGLYQMRAALSEALADGDDRLLVDIRTPELDCASRGARLDLVSAFAVAAAQALAADVPLSEVALLSHWAPAASEIARMETGLTVVALDDFADAPPDAAAYVIVGPANGRPHRAAAEAQARGTPCVLVNHWPTPGGLARWLGRGADAAGARAVGGFTTAFELVPLSLQRALATTDDYVGEGAEQRTRGFVPKAVLLRRYPLPWSLLVDASGDGYEATATYDRRPGPDEMLLAAGDAIKRKQAALKAAREDALREDGMLPERDDDDGDALGGGGGGLGGSLDGAAAPPAAPPSEEVRVYDFDEVQRVALPLYTAGCLLRLRHATAAAGGGGEQPAGLFDDDSDALHLYGAAPDGWGGRNPPELACCAVLRFGDEGGARVEQLAVAPDRRADGWERRLLDAAEAAARRRSARAVALRAPPPLTATRMLLESLGYAEAEPGWLSKEVGGFHSSRFHSRPCRAPFRPSRREGVHEFWLSSHDHGVHHRRSAFRRPNSCEVALRR